MIYPRHESDAVSMLVQRRRRCTNIDLVSDPCFVFAPFSSTENALQLGTFLFFVNYSALYLNIIVHFIHSAILR